jgi:hypothetical protein
MSEYQFVAFRAVDKAVSEKNLAYMRRQSSRAEITPWSFENEYNFGDFHGNAVEMLRRGYDFHLHYANFGVRKLLIRLPTGFPDPRAAKPYLDGDSLCFLKDRNGPGGALLIEPYHEPDDIEELWDLDEILDRLVPLRSEILAGDLRPLFLAHLAVSCDDNHDPDETIKAPVPSGLRKPTNAQLALAKFCGISVALIEAAARESGPPPAAEDWRTRCAEWLANQPQEDKDTWLVDLLSDPTSSVRVDIRAKIEQALLKPSWPTVQTAWTVTQLRAAEEEIQNKRRKGREAKAARQRTKLLQKMAADPTPFLRQTEQLVAQRSSDAYQQASQMLADLREALAGSKRAGVAEKQALKLKTKNPKLHLLTAALRRHGFVPK